MKKLMLILVAVFLLSGCFRETEEDKQLKKEWKEAPVLLPDEIAELKSLCAEHPDLNRTFVYVVESLPKAVMCVYNDSSAGKYENKIGAEYVISAFRLREEKNKLKESVDISKKQD